jgi:ribosomal protein L37E
MTVHSLKTWPEYFEAQRAGRKTFELRRNDRNFQVGDLLVLREWDECSTETARSIPAASCAGGDVHRRGPLPDSHIADGFVIMSTEPENILHVPCSRCGAVSRMEIGQTHCLACAHKEMLAAQAFAHGWRDKYEIVKRTRHNVVIDEAGEIGKPASTTAIELWDAQGCKVLRVEVNRGR